MSEKNYNLKVWSETHKKMSEVFTEKEYLENIKYNFILQDPTPILKYESPFKTSEGNSLFQNDYISIENKLDDRYIIGLIVLTPDGFIIQNVFNHTDISDTSKSESNIIAKIGSVEETPTLVADLLRGL